MENASKALIMAAEILIGMILISILVLGYRYWSNFSNNINTNIQNTKIQEFNSKFTAYDGREDLNIHDIITIINFINEYNKEAQYQIKIEGNAAYIKNKLNNISSLIEGSGDLSFSFSILKYNEYTKVVDTVKINKIKK